MYIKKNTYLLIAYAVIQLLFSCNKKLQLADNDNDEQVTIEISTLDEFYHKNPKPIGEILACGCLEEKEGNPIYTTIFYPNSNAIEYKLFMTDSAYADKNDLTNYHSVPIQIDSMFKGKLLRIDRELPQNSVYAKVVGVDNDSLYISDAIKINAPVLDTEKSPLFVQVDSSNEKEVFSWDKDFLTESKAFLTVVANENMDIRSCSYTTQNYFKLDDLTAVDRVMYPLDKSVSIDKKGSLLWMSVNEDNWITRLAKIPFKE